ncbi:MAG: CcmD family protein [Actinomycetota bacterium]
MSTTTWMVVAFLAVGVGIGGYLLSLSARRRVLNRRLKGLEGRSRRP